MVQRLEKFALVLIAAMLMSASALASNIKSESDISRFADFFQAVVKTQKISDETRVFRWPLDMRTCVYGEYSSSDRTMLFNNLELIEDLTGIRFEKEVVRDIDNCKKDNVFFIRFHSDDERVRNIVFDDIKYINDLTGRDYIQSFASVSNLGNANYGIGGDAPSYLYISVKNSIGINKIIDQDAQNELLQKLLFQVISVITEVKDVKGGQTFLSDDLKSFTFPLTEQKLNFLDRKRKTNLCIDDAMLLRVVYDRYVLSNNPRSDIGFYVDYILNNYDKLRKDTAIILNKYKYKPILPKKC